MRAADCKTRTGRPPSEALGPAPPVGRWDAHSATGDARREHRPHLVGAAESVPGPFAQLHRTVQRTCGEGGHPVDNLAQCRRNGCPKRSLHRRACRRAQAVSLAQLAAGDRSVSVEPEQDAANVGDAGIRMTTVLVMLVVLAVLVVGIFWLVPVWFGGRVI